MSPSSIANPTDQQREIERLAAAIDANCDAYWRDGGIDVDTWDANQRALWREAQALGVLNRLLEYCSPSRMVGLR